MDEARFDERTRTLAGEITRRSVVRGPRVAVLGAVGLTGPRPAAMASNGPCARRCLDLPPGPERGACIAAAAQGNGQRQSCSGSEDVCTDQDGQVLYRADFKSDRANCGGRGRICAVKTDDPPPAG